MSSAIQCPIADATGDLLRTKSLTNNPLIFAMHLAPMRALRAPMHTDARGPIWGEVTRSRSVAIVSGPHAAVLEFHWKLRDRAVGRGA